MHCWNQDRRGFDGPIEEIRPGLTLADKMGTKRIKALEESRENLRLDLLQILDKVSCIDHEIEMLKAQVRS